MDTTLVLYADVTMLIFLLMKAGLHAERFENNKPVSHVGYWFITAFFAVVICGTIGYLLNDWNLARDMLMIQLGIHILVYDYALNWIRDKPLEHLGMGAVWDRLLQNVPWYARLMFRVGFFAFVHYAFYTGYPEWMSL